jgi:hypothetical protein
MRTALLWISGIIVCAFALGACSSTTPIVSEWRNPAYASGSFKRIMIGSPGGEISGRRNFEDEFLAQFRAAGIDALPSYRYMAEDEKLDESRCIYKDDCTANPSLFLPRSRRCMAPSRHLR